MRKYIVRAALLLALCSPLSAVATSRLNANLQLGSQGAQVTRLQQYLISHNYFSGKATGYFGKATRSAVILYQKAHNLSGTGIVGPATRAKINKGMLTAESQAEAATQPDTSLVTAATPPLLAQCLKDSGATFYGAFWAPHVVTQKAIFGDEKSLLPYVECSTSDGTGQVPQCNNNKILSYPTWTFADGSSLVGEQTKEMLSQKTNCIITTSPDTKEHISRSTISEWKTFRSNDYGFQLDYPEALFEPLRVGRTGNMWLFASPVDIESFVAKGCLSSQAGSSVRTLSESSACWTGANEGIVAHVVRGTTVTLNYHGVGTYVGVGSVPALFDTTSDTASLLTVVPISSDYVLVFSRLRKEGSFPSESYFDQVMSTLKTDPAIMSPSSRVQMNASGQVSNTNSDVTVDLKVNGSDGPIQVAPNASITLSWSTTGSVLSCQKTGNWHEPNYGDSLARGTEIQGLSQFVFSPGNQTGYGIWCTSITGKSVYDGVTVGIASSSPTY